MESIGIYRIIRDQLQRAKVSEADIARFLARPKVAKGIASAAKLSNSKSKFTISINEKYKTIQLHVTLERPYTFCFIREGDGFETRKCRQERQIVLDDSYILERDTPTAPSTKPRALTQLPITRKLHPHSPDRHRFADRKILQKLPNSVTVFHEVSAVEQSLGLLEERTRSLEILLNREWESARPTMEATLLLQKERIRNACNGTCKPDPFCLTPSGDIDWLKIKSGACVFVQCRGS